MYPVPNTDSIPRRPADSIFPGRIEAINAHTCMTCATTHMENGKEVQGTMHCKDPQYAHLSGARCWNYTVKEVR